MGRAKQTERVKTQLRANYVVVVADDFVVDVFHNGVYVPDSKRRPMLDRFGASVERIDISVSEGDWLVFNVVNNRLRWGGAYYFAAAGCFGKDEFGFVSQLKTAGWSACDSPSDVQRFIGERDYLRHQSAQAVARPWHEGTKLKRKYAGAGWDGEPVWGTRRNTWLKVVVSSQQKEVPQAAKKKRRTD